MVAPGVSGTAAQGAGAREATARRAAAVCLALLVLGNVAGIAVPAGLGWDFANFYDTGGRLAAGQLGDLYDGRAPVAGHPALGHLDYYGAPLSAWLLVPLASLAPAPALVAFKLENALAYALALLLLYRHLRPFARRGGAGSARFAALFLGAALLFQPFWSVYRVGGQTTPSVFLLLVAGLLAYTRGRFGAAGLAFAVATLIKPAFVTAMAFLVLVSPLRFAVVTGLHYAWLGLVSLALFGWGPHAAFLEKMLANAGFVAEWYYNSSLAIALAPLREAGLDGLARLAGAALKLAGLATCLALAWRARRELAPGPGQRHLLFLLALLCFLLVSDTLWEHYLVVLFPILAWVIAVPASFPRVARRLVLAIVLLSLGQTMVVVDAVRSLPAVQGPFGTAVAVALKSAPVWLAWILCAVARDAWLASHARGMWPRPAAVAPRGSPA